MTRLFLWLGLVGLICLTLLLGTFFYFRSLSTPWPEPIAGVNLELMTPLLNPDEVTEENGYYWLRQLEDVYPDNDEELCDLLSVGGECLDKFIENGYT